MICQIVRLVRFFTFNFVIRMDQAINLNYLCLQGEVKLTTELPKLLFRKSEFTIPALMRLIDLNVLPPTKQTWAEETKTQLNEEMLVCFVLIFRSAFCYPLQRVLHKIPSSITTDLKYCIVIYFCLIVYNCR